MTPVCETMDQWLLNDHSVCEGIVVEGQDATEAEDATPAFFCTNFEGRADEALGVYLFMDPGDLEIDEYSEN